MARAPLLRPPLQLQWFWWEKQLGCGINLQIKKELNGAGGLTLSGAETSPPPHVESPNHWLLLAERGGEILLLLGIVSAAANKFNCCLYER